MTDFFESPEVRALMAKAGIVHRPGLGQAHLDEIAPLLAADGIDMNNLDDDVDIDTLNTAFARANEQHNLALFTPVGVHRSGSLAVLRVCSEALAEGDDERLQAVLSSIDREPAGDTPAISHVIGVALGMLDGWHADPALRATRAPRWERSARAAATDILSLARKGRAFDSLRSLIVRHRGLAVFQGGCLAVAALVVARAEREGVPVAELAARILVDGAPTSAPTSNAGGHSGAAFRRQPAVAAPTDMHTDRALVRAFGVWLRQQDAIAAPTVGDETGMLEQLLQLARSLELDPHDPEGILDLFEIFSESDEPEQIDASDAAMNTLDDYVHFRVETADDSAPWEAVHGIIEETIDELAGEDGFRAAIDSAVADSQALDPKLRSAAFAQTRLIAAVAELLAWIGSGQGVTQTGGIRRSDIEHVAGLLGIRAIGSARRPPPWEVERTPNATAHVQSMYDLPVLAAWWDALLTADLIETTATRVRVGPAASQWSATRPPLALAEMVAGIFVANLIDAEPGLPMLAGAGASVTISRLLQAIAPGEFEAVDEDGDDEEQDESLLTRLTDGMARRTLRGMASVGLLELDDPDAAFVPLALRGGVAKGILSYMAYRAAAAELE